jgi:hypothetical protein
MQSLRDCAISYWLLTVFLRFSQKASVGRWLPGGGAKAAFDRGEMSEASGALGLSRIAPDLDVLERASLLCLTASRASWG